MKAQTTAELFMSHGGGGLKQAGWRLAFLGVDLAVALVTGNQKIMLMRQLNQPLQHWQGHDRACRIPRRTDKQ